MAQNQTRTMHVGIDLHRAGARAFYDQDRILEKEGKEGEAVEKRQK